MNYQPPDNVREALDLAARCEGSTYKANPALLEARCLLADYEQRCKDSKTRLACRTAANALLWALYQANYRIIKNRLGNCCDEDKRIAAEDGLIKAIIGYNPARNAKFSNLAYKAVENELKKLWRYKQRKKRKGRTVPLGKKFEEKYPAPDSLPQAAQARLARELSDLLRVCLAPRERTLMEYLFGLNGRPELTQEKIGEIFGITRSAVGQTYTNLLCRLRAKKDRVAHYVM